MSKLQTTDLEKRFSEIVADNRKLISKVVYMYATDEYHLQDLYQEVMANIWHGLLSFRGESQVSTWIYRIAINTCITYFRHHMRFHSDNVGLDWRFDVTDSDEDGMRMDYLKMIYSKISKLGKLDKALMLLWLDERPYDEIAQITGLTRSNVATRLHRIKAKLIDEIKEEV